MPTTRRSKNRPRSAGCNHTTRSGPQSESVPTQMSPEAYHRPLRNELGAVERLDRRPTPLPVAIPPPVVNSASAGRFPGLSKRGLSEAEGVPEAEGGLSEGLSRWSRVKDRAEVTWSCRCRIEDPDCRTAESDTRRPLAGALWPRPARPQISSGGNEATSRGLPVLGRVSGDAVSGRIVRFLSVPRPRFHLHQLDALGPPVTSHVGRRRRLTAGFRGFRVRPHLNRGGA
jgi:hypothetical protein